MAAGMATYRLDHCDIIVDTFNPNTNAVILTKKYKNQSLYINDYADTDNPTINLHHTKPIEFALKHQPYNFYSSFALTQGKLSFKLSKPYNINYAVQIQNYMEQQHQLKQFIQCCNTKRSIQCNRTLRDITNTALTTPSKHKHNNKQSPSIVKKLTPSSKQHRAVLINSLNKVQGQQRTVLEAVYSGKSVFFTGAAGTGKSYLLHEIVSNVQHILKPDKCLAVTSTTGITATQLSGSTLQSYTSVYSTDRGIDYELRRIRSNRELYSKWLSIQILIIDEISLLSGTLFDYYEEIARLVRNTNKPFGGIQLIVCGDFYQLPAIFRQNETAYYVFESLVFNQCMSVKIELTEVYRQKDQTFIDLLNDLRIGQCSAQSEQSLKSRENTVLDSSDGITPTLLMVKKLNVEAMNERKLAELPGETYKHTAIDTGNSDLLSSNCSVPAVIELKIGAQVILLKNIDLSAGLANGSRGVVVRYTGNNLPVVKFRNGTHIIGVEKFNVVQGGKTVAVRTQIPLALGWCVSIHKSQGMTLEKCIINLDGVFEFGMCYVALSRVKALSGLVLQNFKTSYVQANPKVLQYYASWDQQTPVASTPVTSFHSGSKAAVHSTPKQYGQVSKKLTTIFRTPIKSPDRDNRAEPKRNKLQSIR